MSGILASRGYANEEIVYTHPGNPIGCGETLMITCHECTPAYARYVYVFIPGSQRVLMICELEVYTEGDYHFSSLLTLGIILMCNFTLADTLLWIPGTGLPFNQRLFRCPILIVRFMALTSGPPGAYRTQMSPMLALCSGRHGAAGDVR